MSSLNAVSLYIISPFIMERFMTTKLNKQIIFVFMTE